MPALESDVHDTPYFNPSLDLRRVATFAPPAYSTAQPLPPDPNKWWVSNDNRPPVKRRVVLFIHGFNNSNRDAAASFRSLQERLEKWNSDAAGDVSWVYWPGDARGWLSIASPLIFPQSIEQAIRMGPRLAGAIRALRGPGNTPCDVVLVGHSLGCRLILESLLDLERQPTVNVISLVFLMAAAVPVTHIGGRFAAVLSGPKRVPRRVIALHSDEDIVLQLAFRIGHGRGPDPQLLAEAVGLHGSPRRKWDDHLYMPHYDHGSYWKDEATDEESPVARRLATELQPSRIRDVLLAEARHRVIARDLAARVIPAPDAAIERRLPERRIAG